MFEIELENWNLKGENCLSGEIRFDKALVYRNLRILQKSAITRETHSHAANTKLSENVWI